MKKLLLSAILTAGCLGSTFAQTETKTSTDKGFDHYFSVQVNQLIRQVFNFNNSTSSTINNPYLLNYSINSHETGWGARLGVGYMYNSSKSNDGITATETKINDMSVRLGFEKIFTLADKWSAGAGLDIVYSNNDDHTVNNVNSNFGGSNTDTKTVISSYGAGPMAWLRYHITSKILLGTETSFYYMTGDQKQTITITDPFGGGTSFPTNTSNKVSQGNISAPVVFYLTVKF